MIWNLLTRPLLVVTLVPFSKCSGAFIIAIVGLLQTIVSSKKFILTYIQFSVTLAALGIFQKWGRSIMADFYKDLHIPRFQFSWVWLYHTLLDLKFNVEYILQRNHSSKIYCFKIMHKNAGRIYINESGTFLHEQVIMSSS